ncbi:MAG: primosomal protein N' [Alphaproteobacteria bacterium]|nr:primosomal protein N' [Alphaproteobacteria bacterium]
MQRVFVLFPVALGSFEYLTDLNVQVGQFVKAPLGKKKMIGVVWPNKPEDHFPEDKLKKIDSVLPEPALPKQTIDFVNWVAGYTLAPLGAVLKMALNSEMGKVSKKPLVFLPPNPGHTQIDFSPQQLKAVKAMQGLSGFKVALLDGVTGSGKTEVYFEEIAHILEQKKQVLVLLPEIILTTAWLRRFESRFGVTPALWHSSLTPKQRRDTWEAVRNGSAQVLVGARSALFLPFLNLGLIVVDEEHDPSFKQEEGVLYQARDMAIVRAKIADCPIVLASATPCLETYSHAKEGRYLHLKLPERYAGAELPETRIIDMRKKEKGPVRFISKELQEALADRLLRGEQSLLFLNRRGYAPLMLCRACGHRIQCPHCSAWLVEHKGNHTLQCHHCGYTMPTPTECPQCHEKGAMVACGPGVERIAEEVTTLFPNAKIAQITSDTLLQPKDFEILMQKIEAGELDILIGTQVLAKGHHFPNLTLVGVVDADMGLAGGDLRAGERTFQLLQQVMGRAGREEKKGLALLQSYNPENLIINALSQNDRTTFLNEEMTTRKLLHMPPFGRLASIIVSGRNQLVTWQTIQMLSKKAPIEKNIEILGPVVAPISKLRGKFRYRLLVKTPKETRIQNYLHFWLDSIKIPASVDMRIDIDPYSFF